MRHLSYTMFAALLFTPPHAMANGKGCYRAECSYSAADMLVAAGSALPRRVEPYTEMFGERLHFYPLDRTSHFPGSIGGFARLHRPLTSSEGIVFDRIEFLLTNPPYASELYFHVATGADTQCLHADALARHLSIPAPADETHDFVYSPVTKDLVSLATTHDGQQSCIASIRLRFGGKPQAEND